MDCKVGRELHAYSQNNSLNLDSKSTYKKAYIEDIHDNILIAYKILTFSQKKKKIIAIVIWPSN